MAGPGNKPGTMALESDALLTVLHGAAANKAKVLQQNSKYVVCSSITFCLSPYWCDKIYAK